MHTFRTRGILLLLALAVHADGADLNSCDGAYAKLVAIDEVACPPASLTTNAQKTPATCNNTACATAISGLDDATLSLMKTGFTACGNVNATKARANNADAMNYPTMLALASMCGLPASTVKATAPALNTCDGAAARYVALVNTQCPTSNGASSSATCGNAACATAISSIDDNTLSLMKTGFAACTPGPNSYANTGSYVNYQFFSNLATTCGLPASTVTLTPPVLNTCEGAYSKFANLFRLCPTLSWPNTNSSATCGNSVCATAISSIGDNTLSSMKTGFTACGNLPDSDPTGLKSLVVYATYFNYQYLNSLAIQCGLSASIVTLTAPALSTCDGAYARLTSVFNACPLSGPNSSATCGNSVCATAISSIGNNTLSTMQTGFTACGKLPDTDGMKSLAVYAKYFNYQYLNSLASQCGLSADTVQLMSPGLNTCDGAYGRFETVGIACPAPYSQATCGGEACKTAISSINEDTLSLMKTGFTACGNLPDSDTTGRKSYSRYATYFNYQYLNNIATQCEHNVNTVKLSPPDAQQLVKESVSCDNALAKHKKLLDMCPVTLSTPPACAITTLQSLAACKNTIIEFNDEFLWSMKGGLDSCSSLNKTDTRWSKKSLANNFYELLYDRATLCGFEDNVKLTPCSLCGRELPLPKASEGKPLANYCTVNGQYIGSIGSAQCKAKETSNTYNTFQTTCGQWDTYLKTMWIDDPACSGKRSELQSALLTGMSGGAGIDKKFPDASSKATHCNCPVGDYEAKLAPTQNEPLLLPQTPTQPQITTIFNTVSSDVTHVVKITLSLPMRIADFTSDKQTLFKRSLASAAGKGVLESDVTIEKIETIKGGRRQQAESITVRSNIKVSNQAAADTMAKALTQEKLNDELSKSGLPAAKLLDVAAGTIVPTPEKESLADKVKSEATSAIIGGAIAGVVSFAGLLATYFRKWISSKCGCSGESDQNQEPLAEEKATAEASIGTSTSPNTRVSTENPV